MKYIYKHGNQFWYQRAVPLKIQKIIGKTNIKVCLKTNKISTAVQRSKLQALEHKKMFHYVTKQNYISKVFYKKTLNIKKYQLTFFDEYDDYVTNIFFSKNKIYENIKNRINETGNLSQKKKNVKTIESLLFNIQSKSSLFSIILKTISQDKRELVSFVQKKNLRLFIDICGDKPIYEYNSDDYEKFQLFLLKNNFNAKLILKAVVEVILIGYANLKIKEKINFKKKIKKSNTRSTEINDDELSLIVKKCKESQDLESLIILLLMDTGCTIREVVGVTVDDIYLDSYLPFVIIRSNRFRKIHNVSKLRTVPLVGMALWALKKIKSNKKFTDFFTSKKKKTLLINKLNFKFKKIISNKNLISFRKSFIKRLISINCPERVILDIIGQSKKNRFYSDEISLEIKASWLKQITKY